jgi:hypothetical protein
MDAKATEKPKSVPLDMPRKRGGNNVCPVRNQGWPWTKIYQDYQSKNVAH